MNTSKIKGIYGNPDDPSIVRAWLIEQGAENGTNLNRFSYSDASYIYFLDNKHRVHSIGSDMAILFDIVDPKIHKFAPFEQVLVRDRDNEQWIPAFFSYYNDDATYYYSTGYANWKFCIPYKGNEHLCYTTNNK